MRKNIIIISLFIFLFSCNETTYDENKITAINEVIVTETFDEFNAKFHSDSIFQISRISFPLEGQQVEGFNKKNWTINNWTLMKLPVGASIDFELKRKIEKTDSSVTEKIWLDDSGFKLERIFKQKDGKWFLVLYNDITL